MSYTKTHYMVHEFGTPEEKAQWRREGLIVDQVKFCDGRMLNKSRYLDFTKNTEDVDCKRCLDRIDRWVVNGFDLPY